MGILATLGGPGAVVFSDELNHSSIIDGCRLSRSRVQIYRHADADHLESLLRTSKARRKIIVTDSVFSMDGDVAPLPDFVSLKSRYGAVLVVDDAHAVGVLPPRGRGSAEYFGLPHDAIDVQMDTLEGPRHVRRLHLRIGEDNRLFCQYVPDVYLQHGPAARAGGGGDKGG